MARLWSSGHELGSSTAGHEWTSVATITNETTTVRSGTYSVAVDSSGGTRRGVTYDFASAAGDGPYYVRTYFRISALPNAEMTIFALASTSGIGGAQEAYMTINSTGVITLYSEDGSLGTSSALSTETWYRLEILFDRTPAAGSEIITGRIDGTQFASSSTVNMAQGILTLKLGCNLASEGAVGGTLYFDDIAINDSTGSFQNSWPGEGEIIHLRPNAAGDNAGWDEGTSALFSAVDEVTPNDATDYILTNNDVDTISDFNLDATAAALASDDTINCVQVGVRYNGETTTTSAFALRIKASSGGTVEESGNSVATGTTWRTNANAAPRNYALTLYDLPGASTTAWTKTDLDAAQIGVNVKVRDGLDDQLVSTLWLLVDHKPAAAPPAGSGAEYRQTIIGSGLLPFYG